MYNWYLQHFCETSSASFSTFCKQFKDEKILFRVRGIPHCFQKAMKDNRKYHGTCTVVQWNVKNDGNQPDGCAKTKSILCQKFKA